MHIWSETWQYILCNSWSKYNSLKQTMEIVNTITITTCDGGFLNVTSQSTMGQLPDSLLCSWASAQDLSHGKAGVIPGLPALFPVMHRNHRAPESDGMDEGKLLVAAQPGSEYHCELGDGCCRGLLPLSRGAHSRRAQGWGSTDHVGSTLFLPKKECAHRCHTRVGCSLFV